MILRKNYLDQIIPLIDKNLIKVLTGVRRSGKTVLLQQIQDYLLQHGRQKNNVVYISFESKANAHLKNSDALYSYLLDAGRKANGKRISSSTRSKPFPLGRKSYLPFSSISIATSILRAPIPNCFRASLQR